MAVRFYKAVDAGNGKMFYEEGYCDSTDTKPTEGIAEGSCLTETDTGDIYLYNEASEDWVKQMSLQGI